MAAPGTHATNRYVRSSNDRFGGKADTICSSRIPKRSFESAVLSLTARWKRGIIPALHLTPNRRVTWQATSDAENS